MSVLSTRAVLPGGVHEGIPFPPLDARHTIEQVDEDVIVSETTDAGGRLHYAVRLPLSLLVHLALNTTAEERAEIDVRADWRGVP